MIDSIAKDIVDSMVRSALEEDGAGADATVAFLDIAGRRVRAEIRVDRAATICGIGFARSAFYASGASGVFAEVADGERVEDGALVALVEGDAGAVLSAERVALNFLQRLSGVSTLASQFVSAVEGTGVAILDTRKTTPLWRDAEKYAVRCGGAQNHRRALNAMVLIKENHIRAAGGRSALRERIESRRREADGRSPFVEVEVDSLAFLDDLLGAPVDRVMLDNFKPAEVERALAIIAARVAAGLGTRPEVEVSGGVTLETIRDYALPGVDFVSVGALTHSAPASPMSLEVV